MNASPPSTNDRHGERGIVSLLAVVGMSIVLLMLIVGLSIVEVSARSIVGQLKYQGQAANVARAGTTNALVWFQQQSTQPVTGFAPQRNLLATPPLNDTDNASLGIVRTFPISGLGNVWGRYEVRTPNVLDVSVQRGKVGAGTIWQFDAYGLVFVDKNGNGGMDFTDTNANGVFDWGEPGEVVAIKKVRAEAQRLSVVLPAGNAALQGYKCSTIGLTSGAANNRVLGSSSGTGIACRTGTGSPSYAGANVTGVPVSSTSVNPYNDSIPSIFGVSQNELSTLANYNVPDAASLPATLPGMSLIVIQADATFTTARPLVGSGILVVLGNLTIPAGSNFNGVIYVTGNYSQAGPSLVSGAVVGHANITMTGGADITEVDWDATIVQEVRNALGGYRLSRTEYAIP